MKNLASAAKTLAVGGMLLTTIALVYLHQTAGRVQSLDPYDNIADVGAGANAFIMLLVGAGTGALAAIALLGGAASFVPLRTRSTLYWLILSIASPAIFIAMMWPHR